MNSNNKDLVLHRIKNRSVFPSLPLVAYKLNEIVDKEGVTCSEIEDIIMKDAVLTTKLLKIVNCSFYGFPQKISSVSKAALILGFNVIRTIIITTPILEKMRDIDVALWEHSSFCSIFSGYIAKKLNIKYAEVISTAALIQNIGLIFIRLEFPEIFMKIIDTLKKENISLTEAEIRIFGIDHAEIGSELLLSWNLPSILVETIKYHHCPSRDNNFSEISSIIHFSDILTSGLGVTSASDIYVPPFDKKILEILTLDNNWIIEFFEDTDTKMIFKNSEKTGEEFIRKDFSNEDEKINDDVTNSKTLKIKSLSHPQISIKKKLTFLKKRFSRVNNDPFLILIMKLIAKQYLDEEKLICR